MWGEECRLASLVHLRLCRQPHGTPQIRFEFLAQTCHLRDFEGPKGFWQKYQPAIQSVYMPGLSRLLQVDQMLVSDFDVGRNVLTHGQR